MAALSLGHVGLSLAAGSLTTLSPCVFPMLPLVLGGAIQGNRLAPVVMGSGMAISFALIGMLVGALGPALGIDSDNIRVSGALLLVAFGLVILIPALNRRFSEWMLPIASSANNASSRLDGGSLGGAFLLGGVLGLVWSPCSGPLLASALTLVASEGGAARGALILGLFGIGAAMPLVAVAYASRRGFSRARGWVLTRIDAIKKGFGIIILLTGIAVLTGADKWIESRVVGRLPDAWINATTLL
ncbi:cytochrome c biogenesis protein CcdA [uncultured Propionivibrio sp.]|uniref:cytochrome c biogenesis CcdA family protein n=1 Tax=uncultured Propionivibrio sp. TaxID=426737 RepID=UPI0029C0195B|nr:cytochrome c biogenesis protein CcdA [uncultured Propionivibrio sp.]